MFFGFGVGDFLAISALAVCAYSCLQDSTGSRADYQSLRMIRQSVGNTLVEAETNLKLNPGCFQASFLLIKMCFEKQPEHGFVTAKNFDILAEDENGKTIIPNHWGSTRKPGMFISMALLKEMPSLSKLSDKTIRCPACNTPRTEHGIPTPFARVRCRKCCKWFDNFDSRYLDNNEPLDEPSDSNDSRKLLSIIYNLDYPVLNRVRRWRMLRQPSFGASGLLKLRIQYQDYKRLLEPYVATFQKNLRELDMEDVLDIDMA